MIRPVRSRPQPEIVVQRRRYRCGPGGRAPPRPAPPARARAGASSRLPAVRASDAPQLSRLHELDHAAVVGQVVVDVVAHLGDALVLQRSVRHHAPLGDAVAEGLLDEHVLARFERAHGGERMPVIGRDDGDGVNLGVGQDAAEVAVDFRLVPARLLDLGHGAVGVGAIDVADRPDPHIGLREELPEPARALPADADHAHARSDCSAAVRQDAPVHRGHRGEAAGDGSEECSPGDFRWCHHNPSLQLGRSIPAAEYQQRKGQSPQICRT